MSRLQSGPSYLPPPTHIRLTLLYSLWRAGGCSLTLSLWWSAWLNAVDAGRLARGASKGRGGGVRWGRIMGGKRGVREGIYSFVGRSWGMRRGVGRRDVWSALRDCG